jgi:hypothetical protein
MLNPDVAFKKIRSGKTVSKRLKDEVVTWESSDEPDKLNAWCLLFLNKKTHFKKVLDKLALILSSNDIKAVPNALLVLMYASDEMLLSPRIKKAVRHAFLSGGDSVRINATRILAAQKDLGDATAKNCC